VGHPQNPSPPNTKILSIFLSLLSPLGAIASADPSDPHAKVLLVQTEAKLDADDSCECTHKKILVPFRTEV
jgi:hypothetical protein